MDAKGKLSTFPNFVCVEISNMLLLHSYRVGRSQPYGVNGWKHDAVWLEVESNLVYALEFQIGHIVRKLDSNTVDKKR